MALTDDARMLMDLYPRIFHACHVQHVRDARLRRTLSANQASILDHLDDVEATSMNALAGHMGVTASTMSLAIDRLERAGYVKRGRDARDGRRVLLRLTSHGVRIKDMQKVLDPERVKLLLGALPAQERTAAIRGLALLAGATARMPRKHPGRGWTRSSGRRET
jgi:DNA-binding MarR family transcriptional regulator